MHFDFTVFAGFSISLAAIIGWLRYKNLDPDFFPFLILITMGLVNETISYIVIGMKKSNAVNFNIYTLLELLLLTWQFQKWKLFGKKAIWAKTIALTGIVFWLAENFLVNSIRSFNSYFLIFSAYIIVLMSITMINRLALKENNLLIKNPIFLICLGLLLFFTYAVLVEAFW